MRRLALVAVLAAGCSAPGKAVQPVGAGSDGGDAIAATTDAEPAPETRPAPEPIGTPFGDGTVDARLVNEPGKVVPLEQILVPGKVTVIDFWADWCGACKVMEKKLLAELAGVDGVVVRKLDLVDDVSEVSTYYRVGRALPEMWIFDQRGKRVHQLRGGDVANAGRLARELAAGGSQ